jgi:hypothetical protein
MAYREFTDAAGVHWRAWDTYPSAVSNVRSVYVDGWLGFESEGERRRLHPVPQGWADATDDALRGWLRAAAPVAMRPTEAFLQQPHPETPRAAGDAALDDSEGSHTRAALMDATRAVVERARSVLNVVTTTLAQARKDDEEK